MHNEDLATDLLRGTPAIAKFIGQPVRQTYYVLETKRIPAFKMGKIWTRENRHYAGTSSALKLRRSATA